MAAIVIENIQDNPSRGRCDPFPEARMGLSGSLRRDAYLLEGGKMGVADDIPKKTG
jgi:hypothetical protein